MNPLARIDDHVHRSFEGSPWYASSLTDALAGVTAAQAASRPLPAAHSIWEIVLHLTTWYTVPRLRLDDLAADVSPAEDWPAVVDTGEDAWARALDRLRQSYLMLRAAVNRLDPDRLDHRIPPDKRFTIDMMLRGVAEHVAYHSGQIVLLKKAIAQPPE